MFLVLNHTIIKNHTRAIHFSTAECIEDKIWKINTSTATTLTFKGIIILQKLLSVSVIPLAHLQTHQDVANVTVSYYEENTLSTNKAKKPQESFRHNYLQLYFKRIKNLELLGGQSTNKQSIMTTSSLNIFQRTRNVVPVGHKTSPMDTQ